MLPFAKVVSRTEPEFFLRNSDVDVRGTLAGPFSEKQKFLIFVLRKEGRKTKKRMKEEEMEEGDCRPPT